MMSASDGVKVQLTKNPKSCQRCPLPKMLKKKSHFQAVYLSGKVNTVIEDDTDYFLSALGLDKIDSLHIDPWKTNVSVNGNSVEFKLDTGADVSAVTDFIIPKLNATLQ